MERDHIESRGIQRRARLRASEEAQLAAERMVAEEGSRTVVHKCVQLGPISSGRTLWWVGTDVAFKYPMSPTLTVASLTLRLGEDTAELFYLLMLGSGVGFKCTKQMARDLPPIRVNTKLILSEYKPVKKDYRLEDTDLRHLEKRLC